MKLPANIRKVSVSEDAECAACQAKCLDLEYFSGDKTLACLACEDELSEGTKLVHSRNTSSDGRGRGRGRGRGGRGGGRGRGDNSR